MTLRLVIEAAPGPQTVTEREFDGGQLSIGRGDDADWQLTDPNAFVSRRHCILSEEGGRVMVTDASSGGLFIDNAANPVGPGNSVPLEPGMRLHMGDFTLRIEAARPAPGTEAPRPRPAPRGGFFADEPAGPPPDPPAPRPDSLPDPFGLRSDGSTSERHKEVARPPRPLDQADPFGLDLRRGFDRDPAPAPEPERPAGGGGYFSEAPPPSTPPPATPPQNPAPPAADTPARKPDIFDTWNTGAEAAPVPAPPRTEPPAPQEAKPPPAAAPLTEPATPGPTAAAPSRPAPTARPGDDLRDALLRGMGLDPASVPRSEDPAAEMAHLGRCMHDLVEGVMLLLRTRAQEKQKVRVAQTIIASADVNPLKFLATPEDALTALIHPRGRGYLAPDAAVPAAFRDLADHQVRTWSALQIALRRMVDKFDPAEIEKEMADVGVLEALAAGGRKAKLWQIYEDRYRDIARSAEQQFLGDVGGDFRDAYENKGS